MHDPLKPTLAWLADRVTPEQGVLGSPQVILRLDARPLSLADIATDGDLPDTQESTSRRIDWVEVDREEWEAAPFQLRGWPCLGCRPRSPGAGGVAAAGVWGESYCWPTWNGPIQSPPLGLIRTAKPP
jgi:hypothetical protein